MANGDLMQALMVNKAQRGRTGITDPQSQNSYLQMLDMIIRQVNAQSDPTKSFGGVPLQTRIGPTAMSAVEAMQGMTPNRQQRFINSPFYQRIMQARPVSGPGMMQNPNPDMFGGGAPSSLTEPVVPTKSGLGAGMPTRVRGSETGPQLGLGGLVPEPEEARALRGPLTRTGLIGRMPERREPYEPPELKKRHPEALDAEEAGLNSLAEAREQRERLRRGRPRGAFSQAEAVGVDPQAAPDDDFWSRINMPMLAAGLAMMGSNKPGLFGTLALGGEAAVGTKLGAEQAAYERSLAIAEEARKSRSQRALEKYYEGLSKAAQTTGAPKPAAKVAEFENFKSTFLAQGDSEQEAISKAIYAMYGRTGYPEIDARIDQIATGMILPEMMGTEISGIETALAAARGTKAQGGGGDLGADPLGLAE